MNAMSIPITVIAMSAAADNAYLFSLFIDSVTNETSMPANGVNTIMVIPAVMIPSE